MKKYVLLPANFEFFNIEQLKKEFDLFGGLCWEIRGQDYFNTGDIIYIYYTGLTDGSNRILFRGTVDKINIDFVDNKGLTHKGIVITNLYALSLYDKEKFNCKRLKTVFGLKNFQNKNMLCTESDLLNENNLKIELVKELEKSFESNRSTRLETVNYFNNNVLCECCNIMNFSKTKAQNRTFKKNNGFLYYEVHHLLMNNLSRKNDQKWLEDHKWFNFDLDKNRLDDDFNKVNLCPVCHREFHYGYFEYNNSNIKNKVDLINKIFELHEYENHLKTDWHKTEEEIEEIKKYIIEQYS